MSKKTIEIKARYTGQRQCFQDGTPNRCIIGNAETSERKNITIKGECQPDDLRYGVLYRFDGEWKNHPKFGPQFCFHSFCQPAPSDRASIESYLSTCPGIGETRAMRIFEKFGMDCIAQIKADASILTKIRGITKDMAEAIRDSLLEREADEQFTIELNKLVNGFGFPKRLVQWLRADFGTKAPEIVRSNPFVLTKYKGIGFTKADELYMTLGLPHDSLLRQKHAVEYVVETEQGTSGSTWTGLPRVASELRSLIGTVYNPSEAIKAAVEDGLVVTAADHEERGTFLAIPNIAADEEYVANWLYKNMRQPGKWPKALLSEEGCTPSEHQTSQYEAAIRGCVAALNGGPGTGKTWLVARMIKTLQATGAMLAVCAPTGKAALRVVESLKSQGVSATATTIHGLLGSMVTEGGWSFKHSEDDPLPYDFIVVDESSMIDISLLAKLLKAIKPGGNVLFVGDPDQLSPVGRGAPLRDMIAAEVPRGKLSEIRRNAGAIVLACQSIAAGEMFNSHTKQLEHESNLVLLDSNLVLLDTPQRLDSVMDRIRAIEQYENGMSESFSPVNDMQIIVAVNEKSPLSRKALNEVLQNHYNPIPDGENPESIETKVRKFRPLDKIICLTNGNANRADSPDTQVRVANGDIGYLETVVKQDMLVEVNDSMVVVPSHSDQWGEANWDLGYAISCHKSQGSEWPVVVVILDASRSAGMICDRHWIYTAISRARRRCYLLGSESAALAMIRQSKMWERKTRLVEKMQELKWAHLNDVFKGQFEQ